MSRIPSWELLLRASHCLPVNKRSIAFYFSENSNHLPPESTHFHNTDGNFLSGMPLYPGAGTLTY
ncbi:hypothetical protein EBL_c19910 [Shimwellia blattae DSM 4481 = NBRC 105725]|uniref:Uncharacterized protein n=1 Tax=Shimwellia blattae (strain ATCC 29907 / DSM 4481 / JCM 1650 / NBRC 105725 / CDC 9005-74) TaxID=630626 RepID=I2B978_SHIBC|nr:hypothetical protein EBL_c19910 [Shimwellia blattae DSM 4481 = NBRC 105725]